MSFRFACVGVCLEMLLLLFSFACWILRWRSLMSLTRTDRQHTNTKITAHWLKNVNWCRNDPAKLSVFSHIDRCISCISTNDTKRARKKKHKYQKKKNIYTFKVRTHTCTRMSFLVRATLVRSNSAHAAMYVCCSCTMVLLMLLLLLCALNLLAEE